MARIVERKQWFTDNLGVVIAVSEYDFAHMDNELMFSLSESEARQLLKALKSELE
jgi:hypothetical protein